MKALFALIALSLAVAACSSTATMPCNGYGCHVTQPCYGNGCYSTQPCNGYGCQSHTVALFPPSEATEAGNSDHGGNAHK
jgi:hypothetical protein